jgi:cobalt-zinc-cadmium efflux system outer membrane protein
MFLLTTQEAVPDIEVTTMRWIVSIVVGGLLWSVQYAHGAEPQTLRAQYDLTQLLSIALQRNPSLAVVEAEGGESRGRLLGAQAYPNPELKVEAGPGRALDGPPNRGTEESVRFSQPLEWVPKRSARIKAAEQGVEVSEFERKDAVFRVTAEVASAFYALLGGQRELMLTVQTLTAVEQLAATARKRVEAGEAAKFERVKAEVELQRATKEVERARSRVTQARAALESAVGGDLGRDFEILGEFPEERAELSLESLLAGAMRRHPIIQAHERDQARHAALLDQAKASRVPDVSLFGGFEREIDRETYRAGVTIPLPLWSQRQGEIAEATAAVRRAEAEARQARLELTRGITQAYEQYRIAKGQLDLFRKGILRQSEEALTIARKSYQVGEVSLLELLDAQRVAVQVNREYYQTQVDLATALAHLERLAGGLP